MGLIEKIRLIHMKYFRHMLVNFRVYNHWPIVKERAFWMTTLTIKIKTTNFENFSLQEI